MVAHEYAHGYGALRQGDPTAFQLGRLTWNPLKHIDPFMTVLLPLVTFFGGSLLGQPVIFGGAKPVPVNPRNYKNFRRGDIIVSLAGVAANFVLAVLFTAVAVLLGAVGRSIQIGLSTLGILQQMFIIGIQFNLILVFFNLIPIPPLDGSHVMKYLLPASWASGYQRIGMYGLPILLLLLTIGRPLIMFWLKPVFILDNFAMGLVAPFMIVSPRMSGP
jgi:Zn-dependent protease